MICNATIHIMLLESLCETQPTCVKHGI